MNLENLFKNRIRTVVTAHRGFSGQYPENTILAFQEAIRIGADFVEFDLRGTSDDVPVVIHDQTVDRTSDGNGFINDFSFAEIKNLNFSHWKGSHNEGGRVKNPVYDKMSIPAFEEMLKAVKGKVCLNIQVYDTKPEVLKEICHLYSAYDLYKEGYLSMSTYEEAELVRKINPEIELCVLERQSKMDRLALVEQKKFGCTYIQPMCSDASEEFCVYAAELGLCPSMFFSNNDVDNKKYIAMGMPGLLTDHPDILLCSHC